MGALWFTEDFSCGNCNVFLALPNLLWESVEFRENTALLLLLDFLLSVFSVLTVELVEGHGDLLENETPFNVTLESTDCR